MPENNNTSLVDQLAHNIKMSKTFNRKDDGLVDSSPKSIVSELAQKLELENKKVEAEKSNRISSISYLSFLTDIGLGFGKAFMDGFKDDHASNMFQHTDGKYYDNTDIIDDELKGTKKAKALSPDEVLRRKKAQIDEFSKMSGSEQAGYSAYHNLTSPLIKTGENAIYRASSLASDALGFITDWEADKERINNIPSNLNIASNAIRKLGLSFASGTQGFGNYLGNKIGIISDDQYEKNKKSIALNDIDYKKQIEKLDNYSNFYKNKIDENNASISIINANQPFDNAVSNAGATLSKRADLNDNMIRSRSQTVNEAMTYAIQQQSGHEKESLTGDLDDDFNDKKVEVNGQELPMQIGKTYYDAKELKLDAKNQPVLDDQNNPIYVDKYEPWQKALYSVNSKVLADKGFWLTDGMTLIGEAGNSAALAFIPGTILNRLSSAGKLALMIEKLAPKLNMSSVRSAVNIANKGGLPKGANMFDDLVTQGINGLDKKVSGAINSISNIGDRITSVKNLPEKLKRLENFSHQMISTRLMTDDESRSMGMGVFKDTYNEQLDNHFNIDEKWKQETMQSLQEKGLEGTELNLEFEKELNEKRTLMLASEPDYAEVLKKRATLAFDVTRSTNNILGFLPNLYLTSKMLKVTARANNAIKHPISKMVKGATLETVNEGYEEWIPNGYSERAGIESGKGNKHYNFLDFIKNDALSKESIENLESGLFMGGGQSVIMDAGSLKGDFEKYKTQKDLLKTYNFATNQKMEDFMIMVGNTKVVQEYTNRIKKLEIQAAILLHKGKEKEARQAFLEAHELTQKTIVGRAIQSIQNGVNDEFNRTLQKFSEDKNISESDRNQIQEIIELSKSLADIHDNNATRHNIGDILTKAASLGTDKIRKNRIQENIDFLQKQYDDMFQSEMTKLEATDVSGEEVNTEDRKNQIESKVEFIKKRNEINAAKRDMHLTIEEITKNEEALEQASTAKANEEARLAKIEKEKEAASSVEDLEKLKAKGITEDKDITKIVQQVKKREAAATDKKAAKKKEAESVTSKLIKATARKKPAASIETAEVTTEGVEFTDLSSQQQQADEDIKKRNDELIDTQKESTGEVVATDAQGNVVAPPKKRPSNTVVKNEADEDFDNEIQYSLSEEDIDNETLLKIKSFVDRYSYRDNNTVTFDEFVKATVNSILNDSKLSEEEKIEKILKFENVYKAYEAAWNRNENVIESNRVFDKEDRIKLYNEVFQDALEYEVKFLDQNDVPLEDNSATTKTSAVNEVSPIDKTIPKETVDLGNENERTNKPVSGILKLLFSSIGYSYKQDADGKLTAEKINHVDRLNRDYRDVDLDYLLDPDKIQSFDEIQFEFATNGMIIAGKKIDLKDVRIIDEHQRETTFGEWQSRDLANRKEGTEAYYMMLPIVGFHKGTNLGHVIPNPGRTDRNDVYSTNGVRNEAKALNVGLRIALAKQKTVVLQAERKDTFNNSTINPNSSDSGVQPAENQSIDEVCKNAVIGTINSGNDNIVCFDNEGNQYEYEFFNGDLNNSPNCKLTITNMRSGKVVEEKAIHIANHSSSTVTQKKQSLYQVMRMGNSTTKDGSFESYWIEIIDKPVVKNIHGWKVEEMRTNHKQDVIDKVEEAFNILNEDEDTISKINPTELEKRRIWAVNILDSVTRIQGVTITNKGQLNTFKKSYLLSSEKYPGVENLNIDFNQFGKNIISQFNEDGTVKETISYHDHLAKNVKAKYRSYEIIDAETGESKQIFSLQPAITFNFSNKVEEKKTAENKKEVVTATPIENLTEEEQLAKKLIEQEDLLLAQVMKANYDGNRIEIDEDDEYRTYLNDKTATVKGLTPSEFEEVVLNLLAEVYNELGNSTATKINNTDINNTIKKLFNDKYNSKKEQLENLLKRTNLTINERNKIQNSLDKVNIILDSENFKIITGLGNIADNFFSVKGLINQFLEVKNEDDLVFDEGEYVVNDYTKESMEKDMTATFSKKLKMFFSTIELQEEQDTFLGLKKYMPVKTVIGHMQNFMADNTNDIVSLEKVMNKAIENYPNVKVYLETLLGKLKAMDEQLQTEMLYKMGSTNMRMDYIQTDVSDKLSVKLRVMNANSKEPLILAQQQFLATLGSSDLFNKGVDVNEESPLFDVNELIKLEEKFEDLYEENDNSWKKIPNKHYIELLALYGIEANDEMIEQLKGVQESDKTFNRKTKKTSIISFDSKMKGPISLRSLFNPTAKVKVNGVLTALQDLKVKDKRAIYNAYSGVIWKPIFEMQIKNILPTTNAIYTGSKTLQESIRPNLTSSTLAKLTKFVNEDGVDKNAFIAELKEMAYNKNSDILRLLEEVPAYRNVLQVSFLALDAIKDIKQTKSKDYSAQDLSDNDLEIVAIGLLSNLYNNFSDPKLNNKGIATGITKILFPSLSDAAQMYILKTIHYDVKLQNLTLNRENSYAIDKVDVNLLDVAFEQLVEPELNRIIQSAINGKVDIVGYNNASTKFINLPFMNGVFKQVKKGKRDLIVTLNDYIASKTTSSSKEKEVKDAVIAEYKDEIYNALEAYLIQESEAKFNDWMDKGIIDFKIGSTTKEGVTVQTITAKSITIDDAYLERKGQLYISPAEQDRLEAEAEEAEKQRLINKGKPKKATPSDSSQFAGQFIDLDTLEAAQKEKQKEQNLKESSGQIRYRNCKIAAFDMIFNNLITQANISMSITGDTALYNNNKSNTCPHVIDPTTDIETQKQVVNEQIQWYEDYSKALGINLSKRLKMFISPGNKIANSKDSFYTQIFLNDTFWHSNTFQSILSVYYPDYNKEVINAKLIELDNLKNKIENTTSVFSELQETEDQYDAIIKELQKLFPRIASYLEIEATNAQEYSTWQEHLHILKNQGNLTSSQYSALKEINRKLSDQSLNGVNESNKLNDAQIDIVLNPIKPLYAGNDVIKDKKGNKINNMVYIKTSSFPLIPQLTNGFQLDNVRKNMEAFQSTLGKGQEFLRASYKSGNKVGSITNALSFRDLANLELSDKNSKNKMTNIKKLKAFSKTLSRENFYIQQDVPSHFEENLHNNKITEIARGTQFERLLFSDGINHIAENIFNDDFDHEILEKLGIESVDGKVSGQDLYKIYNHLYTEEQRLLRNALNREFPNDHPVRKIEKLQEILLEKTSSQQDREALELIYEKKTKDGNVVKNTKAYFEDNGLIPDNAYFKMPIWLLPNNQKIEQYINSIVEKKLIKLKVQGNTDVVVSQEGFKTTVTSLDALSSEDLANTIFTPSWTGDLEATKFHANGKLAYGQVLTSSKIDVPITDINGKVTRQRLNLKEYATKTEDGRYILNVFDNDQQKELDDLLLQRESFREHYENIDNLQKQINDQEKNIQVISKQILATKDVLEIRELTKSLADVKKLFKESKIKISKLRKNKTVIDTQERIKEIKSKKSIHESILKHFSFRIPSTAQQSGAILEIVGFLPDSAGDMLVVPRDHIEQIGEDYDVDKRNRYFNLTRIDENGNLVQIKRKDFQYKIDKLTENMNTLKYNLTNDIITSAIIINEIATTMSEIDRIGYFDEDSNYELNFNEIVKYFSNIKTHKNDFEIKELESKESLTEAEQKRLAVIKSQKLQDKSRSVIDRVNQIQSKIDKLELSFIKNNLANIYKSVYSSDSKLVQEKIGKVLTLGVYKDSIKLLREADRKRELTSNKNKKFSILSREYQNQMLKLGAGGKKGIAIHANALVFNSIWQQLSDEDKLSIPPFTFGNYKVDGVLGKTVNNKAVDLSFEIKNKKLLKELEAKGFKFLNASEQHNMNANSATDNQKEMIMGYRNENEHTIGVYSLLSNFISMDYFTDDKGKTYPIHLPSLFLSQPILVEYAKLKSDKMGVHKKKTYGEIRKILYDSFGISEDAVIGENDDKKLLTGQSLYNAKVNPGANPLVQKAVIDKFLEMKAYSDQLLTIQSSFAKDLGISYFQTQDKYNFLSNINKPEDLKIDLINNYDKMYGDIVNINGENREELLADGYLDFGDIAIKPTNITAIKSLSAIHTNYNMWKEVLPATNEHVQDIMNNLSNSMTFENRNIDMKYKIMSSLKDYLYTDSDLGIISDIENERNRLLYDSNTNMSLATFLNSIKDTDLFKDNKLLSNFDFKINTGDIPSVIRHRNNNGDKNTPYIEYKAFKNLFESNVTIGEYNKKKYSTRDLAMDLVTYGYLTNDSNAIGYRKLIPISYLEKLKVLDNIQKYQNSDFKLTSFQKKQFERQFIEQADSSLFMNFEYQYQFRDLEKHDSEGNLHKIPMIEYINDNADLMQVNIEAMKKYHPNFTLPPYVLDNVYDAKDNFLYTLTYELVNEKYYKLVENVTDYYNMASVVPQSKIKIIESETTSYQDKELNLLDQIEKIDLVSSEESQLLSLVKDFIDEDTKIVYTKNLPSDINGFFIQKSKTTKQINDLQKRFDVKINKNTIYININNVKRSNFSDVLIEEVLHSITVDTVSKYVDGNKYKIGKKLVNGKIDLQIPEYDVNSFPIAIRSQLQDLLFLYKETVNTIADELGHAELLNYLNKNKTEYYPLLNFNEFIAGMYSNSKFKEKINDIKINDQSLLTKFVESVKKLIKALLSSNDSTILEVGNTLLYDFLSSYKQSVLDNKVVIIRNLDKEGIKRPVTEKKTAPVTTKSPINKSFKLSIDKKGKDQGKADLSNALITYPNPGTSSYQYAQDAKKQKIPVNDEIKYGSDVIAMVSVNGNNKATDKQIEDTYLHARKVIETGGTIIMDSTYDANRSWNLTGEALVQEQLGKPTGQTSKGYNYWGLNPENNEEKAVSKAKKIIIQEQDKNDVSLDDLETLNIKTKIQVKKDSDDTVPFNKAELTEKDVIFAQSEEFKSWVIKNNLGELYINDPKGVISTYKIKCK